MFDQDYKKFVMGLMKPGNKMDAEINKEEEQLLCSCLNIGNDFGTLANIIVRSKEINNIAANGTRSDYLAVTHMMIGVLGEIGEITDSIKKAVVYRKPVDINNFIEEIGDILFYFCALCELLPSIAAEIKSFVRFHIESLIKHFNTAFNCTITLEQCIEQNKQKLSKRYAEGKYTDEQAKARADKAE